MAPEVYNNQPYNLTADIYSLGLVLHWMLNEHRSPFMPLPPALAVASQEEAARAKRFNGIPIPPPAHGSKKLKKIILKACAYDSKDRFQSAEEMLRALDGMNGAGSVASATSPCHPQIEQDSEDNDTVGVWNEGSESPVANVDDTNSDDETVGGFDRDKAVEHKRYDRSRKSRPFLFAFGLLCLAVITFILLREIIDDRVGIYNVTLTAVSDSKEYDGTPLRNTTVKSTMLASEKHTITADYIIYDDQGNILDSDPVEVGVYTKKVNNIHIWDSNNEITKQYQITTVDGYLTITAPETIVTPSPEPTDLRLMGPFSSGRFYFMNGASVQIPEGFSDTNTSGDYRSANNTGGYVYVFNNSEYDMTITLSEDYVSTYRDTGNYGVSDYELLSTLREELIDARGTPSWRSLFPEFFKLTGYLGESIYYTYGVIDNEVLYIIDFFYPEKNRQFCDRIVEVTEASFSGASGQQANTNITISKPSAKDLDEINAIVVYPASDSYYLDAYETKFVQSQTGKSAVYFFIDPDSQKDVMRNGNYQVVYNGTEATVIARSPNGWSCVIFPSMNCAGWINSNYLVSK